MSSQARKQEGDQEHGGCEKRISMGALTVITEYMPAYVEYILHYICIELLKVV